MTIDLKFYVGRGMVVNSLLGVGIYRGICTVSLVTIMVSAAAAQQADRVYVLPEITVVGGGLEGSVESALIARRESPNAKVVIEGEQLNQFNDLSAGDAIRRLPGVTFPGVNRPREIKLRGIGKEYTQVLIDGRPLIDGDASRNFEVDRIPASMIERIEITRSPLANSASLGAAGTVNIITKRQFKRNGGGVSVGAGYLTENGPIGDISGWTSGEEGAFRYFLGGDYQRRRVNESSSEDIFGANGTTPNRGTRQSQSRKFDEYFATGRFEYDITDADMLTFSPTFSRSHELRDQSEYRLNGAQTGFDRRTDETRNRTRQTFAAYTEWKHEFSAQTQSRLFLDWQTGSEDTTRDGLQQTLNPNTGAAAGAPSPDQRIAAIRLGRLAPGFVLNTEFDGHAVEGGFGASFSTRKEHETRYRNGGVEPNLGRTYRVAEDIFYGYVMDTFSPTGPDELTVGLRVEHSITKTTDVANDDFRIGATAINPSLQYKYALSDALDLRMGVARTLRRPDLRDLTPTLSTNNGSLSSPHARGNPNTKPEDIWGFDGGADWYVLDGKGIVSANIFARNFRDKIENSLFQDPTVAAGWISEPRNVGDGTLYGAELEVRSALDFVGIPNLTAFANATLMKSRLTDELTGQTRRFAETPNAVTNIGLDYYVPDWKTTFGLNLNTVHGYSQDIAQLTNAPGVLNNVRTEFSTLNRLDFSVKTAISDNFSLSFSALNLLRPTDRRVRTTFDQSGNITSLIRSAEPSYSTYYVRASYTW